MQLFTHQSTMQMEQETVPKQVGSHSNVPFEVERYREVLGSGGTFRPAARLLLTQGLRTSGLWSVLPIEELRDLTLMLTFLTSNGRIQPTLPELSEAMRVSSAQARARMLRLSHHHWQGQPLLRELIRQNGLDAYLPAKHIVVSYEEPEVSIQPGPPVPSEPRAGREALIAHSRARYAAPRAEVEADIASRMGWGPPTFEDDPPEVAAQKRLLYTSLDEQGMTRN